jgi:hypothetical protein
MMDPKHLLIFVKVVECGGITSAARILGIPKATVSRAPGGMPLSFFAIDVVGHARGRSDGYCPRDCAAIYANPRLIHLVIVTANQEGPGPVQSARRLQMI